MSPDDSLHDTREFLINGPPAVLRPLVEAIEADPAAELVSTGGAHGTVDRLLVRLDPVGAQTVNAALHPPEGCAAPAGGPVPGTDTAVPAATAADTIIGLIGSDTAVVEPNYPLHLDQGDDV